MNSIQINGSKDSITQIDSKLKEKYKASIFDFAFLLAIALNDDFLPQKIIREQIKDQRNTIKKSLAKLEKHRKEIEEDRILEEDIEEIDKKIKVLKEALEHFQPPRGQTVSEKARLILLWSQLIREEKSIRKKKPECLDSFAPNGENDIFHGYIEEVEWNDFYEIVLWFYLRLKSCSYSHLIQPKSNKEDEKKNLKSSLQQNSPGYETAAHHKIKEYQTIQQYFIKDNIALPVKIGKANKSYEAYPIIWVNFASDYIEIDELREDGIMYKKVKFVEGKKELVESKLSHPIPKYEKPSVSFPTKESLDITNYTPPFFDSQDLIDKYMDDFITEILSKSKK